jgi:arylformamidase
MGQDFMTAPSDNIVARRVMKVFRHYDQSALELQYDGAARSPELTTLRDARTARIDVLSQRVRTTAVADLDVAYGAHPRERIDIFRTARTGAPLLAFIHGGYWKQRSKSEFAWMAPAFTEAGVAFASIGYPLCPEVRIGEIVRSVRNALIYIAKEAGRHGIDPARIHVAGHSAGGHLTAMMATTDFAALGGPRDLVKSATCVSGLYDLEPLRLVKVNKELRISAEDVDTLSPMRLAPQPHVAIATTVGGEEGEEFLRHTRELTDAWRKRGAAVAEVAAPGFHHFNVLDELGESGKPMHAHVMRVIGA